MVEQVILNLANMVFFGNELWRYLLFIIILLLNFPAAKIIVFILNNYLKKWASKTSTKFDDIIVESLNPPITMFIFAGFFFLAMNVIEEGIFTPFFTKVLNFLLIIPFVYFLIKFSTAAIGQYLKDDNNSSRSKHLNEAAIDLLMTIIKIALIIIGVLLILGNLGYDISALIAGVGIGGLAFALAAQDILKNFFAGIALIFDKTFNKGERINFQGQAGKIEKLNLRSTKVRTFDGSLLTIPNAMLADNIVENVNQTPKVRVKMTLGVTYNTSSKKLEQAKKIIEKAVKSEKVTKDQSINIWFDNFGAYSLDIQVIYYTTLTMNDWPERVLVKDRINTKIKDEFEKAGIEFAFPTQTLDVDFRDEQLKALTKK